MIKSYVSNQTFVLKTIAALSFLSLAAAFFAEAILLLEPCELCIYQRIPFAGAFIISAAALIRRRKTNIYALGAGAALFLGNAAIALYHSGVERKWWASAIEGCSIPTISDDPKTMLENIMSAPTGNCAEIPWADPIFGLSMANYNIALCGGLFMLCAACIYFARRTP